MASYQPWDKTRLTQLVADNVQESLTLDYKRGAALSPKTDGVKTEISKDVSAFANSAGGVIIYGIAEENNRASTLEGVDPNHITREWLDQVIGSRIHQRIDGVRLSQVDLGDGSVAYVVEVPQSDRAPHMASDHRYYKRFEFRSVPMEDYEVRDVGRRAHSPRLRIRLVPADRRVAWEIGSTYSDALKIHTTIGNDGPVPAEYAVIRLLADARLHGAPPGFAGPSEAQIGDDRGKLHAVVMWNLNWNVPSKLPIWDGIDFRLCDTPWEMKVPSEGGEFFLGWSVVAPGMAHVGKLLQLVVRPDGELELRNTGRPLML